MASSDADLTARARIREAAIRHFAEVGFERATVREIARTAGVSPGLLRHHFGSKESLREACDRHVADIVRRYNDQALADGQAGNLSPAAASRAGLQPYQRYIAQAMLDGSATAAMLFDEMTTMTERWLEVLDADRPDPPLADRRVRAALMTAMALGIPLLQTHIARATGATVFTPDGDYTIGVAMLDIYSHRLITPELAATARAGLEAARPTTGKEQSQ